MSKKASPERRRLDDAEVFSIKAMVMEGNRLQAALQEAQQYTNQIVQDLGLKHLGAQDDAGNFVVMQDQQSGPLYIEWQSAPEKPKE